jgi:hypothetical protein
MALLRWEASPSPISVTGSGARKARRSDGQDADQVVGVVGVRLDMKGQTRFGRVDAAGRVAHSAAAMGARFQLN